MTSELPRFVGVANFTQISRGPFQACYLGCSLDRECEGKGLMVEALQPAIRYVFNERHLHRVMTNYMTENKRSAKLLQRLGFRIDGSSPDYLFVGGAWREHLMTSLTNNSWQLRSEDREYFAGR